MGKNLKKNLNEYYAQFSKRIITTFRKIPIFKLSMLLVNMLINNMLIHEELKKLTLDFFVSTDSNNLFVLIKNVTFFFA